MININSIFMKTKTLETLDIIGITWIPFLFGLNAIYNILEYLRVLKNNRASQIKKLQESINNTNKKHDDLQHKYDNLYANFQQLNIKIDNLNNIIIELNDSKINQLNIESNNVYRELYDVTYSNNMSEINITKNTGYSEDINKEFIESLSLDYDYKENIDSEQNKSIDIDNYNIDNYNTVRKRSTSLTEVNWTTLTKKFLFG